MKQALNLKQSQRLTMTPQMQQAMRLLQMNTVELSEELLLAHEINPLLELEDPVPAEPDPRSADQQEPLPQEEFELTTEFPEPTDPEWSGETMYDNVSRQTSASSGDSYDVPDNAAGVTLQQSLMSQLGLLGLSAEEKLLVSHLIAYVDDAGYLEATLEEIHAAMEDQTDGGVPELKSLQAALHILQLMEPAGIGARDPGECLLLQLEFSYAEDPDYDLACAIAAKYLDRLAAHDYATLKKRLASGEEELKRAITLIQQLNPHPGYSIGDARIDYITPDVVVANHKGAWLARLNSAALPKVMINQDYQQLINQQGADEKFSKMREQLQNAKWLLANIEKRHSTILSVAAQIVERQQAFFDQGPSVMRPMVLKDVAEALGIHESTVSRAINGKYILTPRGVFELRYFFSTELSLENGETTSSLAIQSLIREMIEKEPTTKPISDMKICQALNAQGYELARRTVAKYREQMNIPPSGKRKTL